MKRPLQIAQIPTEFSLSSVLMTKSRQAVVNAMLSTVEALL